MMDATSQARLKDVQPKLADKVYILAQALELEGVHIRVTQGLRTWADQARLYGQGRTSVGPVVTNALPGHSWHNFGLAVDVAPFDELGKPDWNATHPAWKRIVDIGVSLGLVDGKAWNDIPHLQLTGRFATAPDGEVRQIFDAAGIEEVWKEAGI
jgi:hypothetical protein